MMLYKPKYLSGEIIEVGDRVLISRKRLATITDIYQPDSDEAICLGFSNGGFCVLFDDGDRWLWSKVDEDIELVSSIRCKNGVVLLQT